MRSIPRAALWLGLAGLLPFAWGVLTLWLPDLAAWGRATLGPRFVGPQVQIAYGAVILSFMGGALWGFAAKAGGGRLAAGLALSVLPALWAFATTGGGARVAAANLLAGFVGILAIDALFVFWRLAPRWWLPLRLLLTAGVALALLATVA